jgi:DNA-directed RNA polymerase subunit omega
MARVTVEDCLPHIHNPFDLAMLAAERARQLAEGARPAAASSTSVEDGADGHKPAVTALREIAAGELNVRALRQAAAQRRRHAAAIEEPAAETPEPPAGDGFERRNEAAIAADLEPLPVAGTARERLFEDDADADGDAEECAA